MHDLTTDSIRSLVLADLDRRLKGLPAELGDWEKMATSNGNGWGIHFSQMAALREMIDGLSNRHSKQLSHLKSQSNLPEFADSYYTLVLDLSGSYDVWRVFRIILEQRQNSRLKPLADAADLIAWDCHRTGLQRAVTWGVLTGDRFRPPPLTFLESTLTPGTASQADSIDALGFSVRQYRDMMLPLPIVLHPADQAGSIWSMTEISHEVGHNLDNDLAPKPGTRLSDEFRMLLVGRIHDDRQLDWRRWMREIFADAIAVTFCGFGFVLMMTNLTISLAPGANFSDQDPRSVHPPLFLRLRLLGHMLSLTRTASAHEGEKVVAFCDKQIRPAWLAPYEAEAKELAVLLMTNPLNGLASHSVLELNENLAAEEDRISKLADYFYDPTLPRPHPEQPVRMPFRAVCAASAQAAFRFVKPTVNELDGIQNSAEAYLNLIQRPRKLAAVSAENRAYLNSLTARLRFGVPVGSVTEEG